MTTYLGLDLGTSATKGVILTQEGKVIARARAPHPNSRRGRPGRADPSAWEQSIVAVCLQLAPELAVVSGVGLDTHCPTVVPLGSDGRPVALGITWDNPDLGHYFKLYSPKRDPKSVIATGNHPSQSTFAAIAYHYLRDNDPEAFATMRTLGFAGTWLGALLTGEVAIDPTQASYSGVFDTIGPKPVWLADALASVGIDPDLMPPVRSPLDILGHAGSTFAEKAGIPVGIPVIVGCADTPAASYALGTAPGTKPFVIMGTTHVVNSCRDAPDLRARALQRRGIRDGEWLINGVTNGGDALAAAAELFGYGDKESAVRHLITLAAGASPEEINSAPFFMAHVMPERGPFWFEEPCAGVVGITRSTSRTELARAIVEGVIFADRMVLEATIPPGDESIYLTGAFGEDPVLPQLLADATGREFEVVLEADLPAIGAAAMVAEAINGKPPSLMSALRISPRPQSGGLLEKRWLEYRDRWRQVTGGDLLPSLK